MLRDGEHHLLQKLRISLAVGQTMPELVFDAPLPESEGGTPFQLAGRGDVLADSFDKMPHIEAVLYGLPSLADPESKWLFSFKKK